MKHEYGLDIETHDQNLKDRGTGWVYDDGEILVTGVFDADKGIKTAFDHSGGSKVKKLLTTESAVIIGANIKYDLGWLCKDFSMRARDIKASLVDVAIVESVIDEYQKYSLDALSQKYLKERKKSEPLEAWARSHGLKGDFRKHLKLAYYGREASPGKEAIEPVPDLVRDYVISDADQPVRIWQEQKKIIEARGLWEPVNRKLKLIKVTLAMKQRGVRVDVKKKAENYEIVKAHQDRMNAEFAEKYGKINIGSTKQLAALFDELEVPYRHKIRIKARGAGADFYGDALWEERKRLKNIFSGVRIQKGQLVLYITKQYAGRTAAQLEDLGYKVTNNPNIDKKALDVLRKEFEVAKDVAELKQVTSIIDKFLGPKFDRFICSDGRIRCDFNISGARQTGRFSSSVPNLQQVPSKTVLFRKTENELNLAKLCREVLIPDEGMRMGKMDYSGQENVLMAHFAMGPGAKEIRAQYNANPKFDFHKYMGEATGLYEEYGAEIGRKYAKNCSFGLGYGMQIPTMMETFGWDKDTAEHIMDVYHDAAPFVKYTMDMVSEFIVKRGFIKTLGKKQLHLRSFRGKIITREAYKGFNKLIQGSAADMMEEALCKIWDAGLDDVFPLYLTVHDEIDFGVPMTDEAFSRLAELQTIMQNAILEADGSPRLSVPIRVDPEIGPNWGAMCGGYDAEEEYKTGKKVFGNAGRIYRRISKGDKPIKGVPLTNTKHWKEVA